MNRRHVMALLAGIGVSAVTACASDKRESDTVDSNTGEADVTGETTASRSRGSAGPAVLMVIRHAEKPTGSGAPYGITANGTQDSHSLTVQGWTRAGALTGLFDPRGASGSPLALRPGLSRPSTVLAADPGTGGSNSKRPEETVTPLAAALGADLNLSFALGQESKLVAWLTGKSGPAGPTLVAWEHQHIPAIIAHLGKVTPKPPSSWPGDRFDIVYVFTAAAGGSGWEFTQVPQMLLAGDSPDPIS
jgi:hypothetical protein